MAKEIGPGGEGDMDDKETKRFELFSYLTSSTLVADDDAEDKIQTIGHDTSKERGRFQFLSYPTSSTLAGDNYDEKIQTASTSPIAKDTSKPRIDRWTSLIWPTGWRAGVYGCITSCLVSFLINLLLTIIVVSKYGIDSSGRLTLYHGNCETSKNLNTGVHVFINAMSTIILSSSNYVQQVLCAVTREEVDAAHEGRRRSRWADIGVPSMFNICLMDRRRVALWYLLMFSSLPLHLL
jgi:hypothetical protein